MKTRMMVIVAMVGLIGMAGVAEAVVYDFNGSGGTNWGTGTNWTPDASASDLPDIGGGDTFTVGGAQSTTHASYFSVGGATLGSATLDINTSGTLQWQGVFINSGDGTTTQV
ncbi:MAG: hypothetical protein ABIF82_00130, partial [Planctomycetota bacterium]